MFLPYSNAASAVSLSHFPRIATCKTERLNASHVLDLSPIMTVIISAVYVLFTYQYIIMDFTISEQEIIFTKWWQYWQWLGQYCYYLGNITSYSKTVKSINVLLECSQNATEHNMKLTFTYILLDVILMLKIILYKNLETNGQTACIFIFRHYINQEKINMC